MEQLDYAKKFTQVYKSNSEDKYFREVECNFLMHSMNRDKINSSDYYVSSFPSPICGFGSRASGFMYYCKIDKMEEMYLNANTKDRKVIKELIDFWKVENDITHIREEYPDIIKDFMPVDDFENNYYTAYPLYRFGGAYLDFEKLVSLGISGLMEEIKENISTQRNEFLLAALKALEYFRELIILYRDDAKDVNKGIYDTLSAIIDNPPSCMREAIQLMWLYIGISEVRNYGRMDIILSKFADDSDIYRCISEYFKVIKKRNTIFNGRIILGGRDRKQINACDTICENALIAMKDLHITEPQLTLRCYKGMSKSVYDLALECIADGCSYPLLYNDDINIPNVMNSFEVDESEAQDYVPFGCGEYVLDHKSIGAPNEIINLTKVLEGVLNQGKCILTNQRITKYYIDNPQSFEELFEVVKKELDYQIDILAYHAIFEYQYMNRHCGYIYNSILYDNCISRGKSILDGGIDYLGGTLETYGNINAADSLWAIRELVFNKKILSYNEMLDILMNNFEGHESIRKQCLDVVKYGNDDSLVDNFVNEINQYVAIKTKEKARKYNLSSYLIVIINNQANSHLGYRTAASFDGRKAYEPLANALTPQGGAEKSGITAVLNSVSSLCVDNMAGAVYNLKLSKDMVTLHLKSVENLLQVYFDNGGSQIMISVMDKGELEDAMIHPEKYPNLIVRVGGFSARFIDLDPLVQREVISRAIY